ncbi:MAG: hypothetical protein P8X57_01485 [Cyclobacteriaceae bacterium]
MKTLVSTFLLCLIMVAGGIAQQNDYEYVLFEFMSVNDAQGTNYLEIEEYWSKIHQERIADGSIVGWDLWSLTPADTEGAQYLAVTLYESLDKMFDALDMEQIQNYANKAHNSSQKEFDEMLGKTAATRDIMSSMYLKILSSTINSPEMHTGIYATFDFMKQLDENYERMEDQIFRIWHQQSVDEGSKMSWALTRVILPAGSDVYATHITVSMLENRQQLANELESEQDDSDYMSVMAASGGVQTRDLRKKLIGQLLMMVR